MSIGFSTQAGGATLMQTFTQDFNIKIPAEPPAEAEPPPPVSPVADLWSGFVSTFRGLATNRDEEQIEAAVAAAAVAAAEAEPPKAAEAGETTRLM